MTLELGATTDTGGKGTLGVQIAISIIIVIILFVMLVYLIFLRRKRIKAEEWLEQHKNTLFSQSANLKTEEEILEALVKSKDLKEMLEMEARKRAASKDQSNGLGNSNNAASPLLAGSGAGGNKSPKSSSDHDSNSIKTDSDSSGSNSPNQLLSPNKQSRSQEA